MEHLNIFLENHILFSLLSSRHISLVNGYFCYRIVSLLGSLSFLHHALFCDSFLFFSFSLANCAPHINLFIYLSQSHPASTFYCNTFTHRAFPLPLLAHCSLKKIKFSFLALLFLPFRPLRSAIHRSHSFHFLLRFTCLYAECYLASVSNEFIMVQHCENPI